MWFYNFTPEDLYRKNWCKYFQAIISVSKNNYYAKSLSIKDFNIFFVSFCPCSPLFLLDIDIIWNCTMIYFLVIPSTPSYIHCLFAWTQIDYTERRGLGVSRSYGEMANTSVKAGFKTRPFSPSRPYISLSITGGGSEENKREKRSLNRVYSSPLLKSIETYWKIFSYGLTSEFS